MSYVLRSFLLLIPSLFFFFNVIAQTADLNIAVARGEFKAKQVVGPSPEASELGKYGNTPVSLFTGTPNISVPLLELKGNFLSVPVSLSYNASGLKPEEQATWVGSGWSLNAGGVVTRSVLGNPDLDNNYYGISDAFNPPNSTDVFAFMDYVKKVQDGTYETQPDTYYYNFSGQSGKFHINWNRTIQCKDRNMLKFYYCSSCPNGFFSITDDHGIIYEFDDAEITRLTPSDETGQLSNTTYVYTSSWMLSKIKSPMNEEEIDFEYYTTTGDQEQYQNFQRSESSSLTFGFKLRNQACQQLVYQTSSHTSVPPSNRIKRKFLKKMTLKRGGVTIAWIDFSSAAGTRQDSDFGEDRMLNGINFYSVVNGTDVLVKRYTLNYNYFVNNDNPYFKKRLRLDSVQELVTDGSAITKPAYSFEYNSSLPIPDRSTASLDHWGFYNNSFNTSLVPNVNVNVQPYGMTPVGMGANREANFDGSSCGILQKITYPTGGFTTFNYSLNKAMFADNQVHDAGGLRINTITDYSCDGKIATIKQYDYTLDDGITTSGVGGTFPTYAINSQYRHYQTTTFLTSCEEVAAASDYSLTTTTVSANSIFGLGSIQGSHIGYRQVTETQIDANTNRPLGKTVYKYEVGYSFPNDDDIASGDLKQQLIYDNSGKLVEELTNVYQYSGSYGVGGYIPKAAQFQSSKTQWCKESSGEYANFAIEDTRPAGCTDIRFYPTLYYLDTYTTMDQGKLLVQQVQKRYDQLTNAYLTNTKNLFYTNANHIYPTRIQQNTTSNDLIITEKQYAADYVTVNTNDPKSIGIGLLQSHNVQAAEIESIQYRQNPDGTNKRAIGGSLTTYLQDKPYPNAVYTLEAKSPVIEFQKSQIAGNGAFTYDSHYQLSGTFAYNSSGNLIEQSKTNDVVTTYVWGYNNSYPIAQITGANYSASLGSNISDAVLQNPSTDAALRLELNKIRTNVPNALVSTFTYKPLVGMTSQSDPKNRLTYFDYDGFGRLVNVKDHDGNIVKNVKYNYATGACLSASSQTLFYNVQVSQNFTKGGTCPTGSFPTTLTYTVPYGRYAATSQTAADGMAQTDIANNGQAYANANGKCLFYNIIKSQWIAKNDCSYSQGPGNLIKYIVPAGTFSSEVDQATADNLALADIAANGQAWANANGTCSCADEGKKYINDVCETGTRIEYASEDLGNGQWKCTYVYTFSDGSYSEYYYTYQSFSCPVNN